MTKSSGACRAFAFLLLLLLLGGQAPAAEKEKKGPPAPAASNALSPGYQVKPSEVVLPPGVAPGQYVRSIRPFPNWTLICDENRAKKQRICNISQEILGPAGTLVFSWSLAAMADGRPIMILRTPAGSAAGKILVDLHDGQPSVEVQVYGCDARLCIAYQPVDPRLRAAIETERVVGISYDLKENGAVRTVAFRAPLAGVKQALSAI
ncbi:invasion associated locus B family protein [Aquabacter sp. L1I39]|nr:invasion associated locus B family protein [Aquabacter sp. L1I39]